MLTTQITQSPDLVSTDCTADPTICRRDEETCPGRIWQECWEYWLKSNMQGEEENGR